MQHARRQSLRGPAFVRKAIDGVWLRLKSRLAHLLVSNTLTASTGWC